MMPTRRTSILAALVAAVALTASAGAATRAASAPSGLHPFLLRVDDTRTTTFSRTPAFAWNPVAGAIRYEFRLSTSGAFRESGIVFSDTTLTSPVASPALTLPWITGTPHALYARVRAVLADSTTAWSASFGFDIQPPSVPAPLPAAPGLLRWTPVDGAAALPVGNSAGFAVGDSISVGSPANQETAAVTSLTAGSLGVAAPLKFAHGAGEPVARTSGNIQYRDLELGQDTCAAGRVLRFGKESEPALTSGGEAFASGLSPNGRLQSASATPSFYGAPLVAWTTALGAEVYAVQWSKTKRPFKPETDPATGALGLMTLNTSAVLPLTPGTWYYRVRGYDYSLPTNAQAMSWSEPQAIVATKPTFQVVSGGEPARSKRVAAGGLELRVPSSWSSSRKASATGPKLAGLGPSGSALRLTARSSSAALFVQTVADSTATQSAWSRKAIARMKALPIRTSNPVSCANVSLPAGGAVRCSLTTRVPGGKQAVVVYFLRHRGATYSLTFASAPGAGQQAAYLTAARSLHFTS